MQLRDNYIDLYYCNKGFGILKIKVLKKGRVSFNIDNKIKAEAIASGIEIFKSKYLLKDLYQNLIQKDNLKKIGEVIEKHHINQSYKERKLEQIIAFDLEQNDRFSILDIEVRKSGAIKDEGDSLGIYYLNNSLSYLPIEYKMVDGKCNDADNQVLVFAEKINKMENTCNNYLKYFEQKRKIGIYSVKKEDEVSICRCSSKVDKALVVIFYQNDVEKIKAEKKVETLKLKIKENIKQINYKGVSIYPIACTPEEFEQLDWIEELSL